MGRPVSEERNGAIRRTTYPIIGPVAVLALLFASSTSALRPNTPLDPCQGFSVTAKQFRPVAEKTWLLTRWHREEPKPATIAAERHALQCAAGPGHREAIRRIWLSRKRAFYRYRHMRLERLRFLPYDCGFTRSAIDCGIMFCESGGSYTARNAASTAGGRYQILDSTWATYGGRPYPDSHPAAVAPPAEQDRVAAAIWADVGSSAWACA